MNSKRKAVNTLKEALAAATLLLALARGPDTSLGQPTISGTTPNCSGSTTVSGNDTVPAPPEGDPTPTVTVVNQQDPCTAYGPYSVSAGTYDPGHTIWTGSWSSGSICLVQGFNILIATDSNGLKSGTVVVSSGAVGLPSVEISVSSDCPSGLNVPFYFCCLPSSAGGYKWSETLSYTDSPKGCCAGLDLPRSDIEWPYSNGCLPGVPDTQSGYDPCIAKNCTVTVTQSWTLKNMDSGATVASGTTTRTVAYIGSSSSEEYTVTGLYVDGDQVVDCPCTSR
jgi:hypothetical protein